MLRRHPAFIAPALECRHALVNRSRTDDARLAHLDQHAAFSVLREAGRDPYFAELIMRAASSPFISHQSVPNSTVSTDSNGRPKNNSATRRKRTAAALH